MSCHAGQGGKAIAGVLRTGLIVLAATVAGSILNLLGIALASPPGLEGTVFRYFWYHFGMGCAYNLAGAVLGLALVRKGVPWWLPCVAAAVLLGTHYATRQPRAGTAPEWKPNLTRMLGFIGAPIVSALAVAASRGSGRLNAQG